MTWSKINETKILGSRGHTVVSTSSFWGIFVARLNHHNSYYHITFEFKEAFERLTNK